MPSIAEPSFEELRTKLREQVPFLRADDSILDPLDLGAYDALDGLALNKTPHNPLHVEPLLAEASELIGQCLDYRREGQELEALALTSAIKRLYQSELEEIEREEEGDAGESVFWTHGSVSSERAKRASDTLAKGLLGAAEESGAQVSRKRELVALAATASAEAVQHEAEYEQRRSAEVFALRRRNALRRMIARTLLKESEDGSGLNYVERAKRVRTLFLDTLKDAYGRLVAVEEGIRCIWGDLPPHNGRCDTLPRPAKGRAGFLDALLLWTRRVYDYLEEQTRHDVEVSYRFSLANGVHRIAGDAHLFAGDGTFAQFLTHGIFTVPAAVLEGAKSPRLRSIALQVRFDSSNDKAPTDRYSVTANMIVTPPKHVTTGGTLVAVAPVRAGNVHSSDASSEGLAIGGHLYNINPVGDWELETRSLSHHRYGIGNIKDVFLTLHCVVTGPA